MQISVQTPASSRFIEEPKNNKAATVEGDRRGSLFWCLSSIQELLFLKALQATLQPQLLLYGCTENSCAIWALINHPQYAKPVGIQATWKEAAWE